jgi:hypothetical protein
MDTLARHAMPRVLCGSLITAPRQDPRANDVASLEQSTICRRARWRRWARRRRCDRTRARPRVRRDLLHVVFPHGIISTIPIRLEPRLLVARDQLVGDVI